jgi:hypothetical protein
MAPQIEGSVFFPLNEQTGFLFSPTGIVPDILLVFLNRAAVFSLTVSCGIISNER